MVYCKNIYSSITAIGSDAVKFFIDLEVVAVHLDICCYFYFLLDDNVISKKFFIMTKAKNMREGFTLVTVSATGIVLAPSIKSSYRGKIFLEFNSISPFCAE